MQFCTLQAVAPRLHGSIVAIDMSLSSGLRIVSPMAAMAIFQSGGYPGVCLTSAGLMGALIAILLVQSRQAPTKLDVSTCRTGGRCMQTYTLCWSYQVLPA